MHPSIAPLAAIYDLNTDLHLNCLDGVNDEEARAFHGYFVRGTVVFVAVAIVAHILQWSWRPWL